MFPTDHMIQLSSQDRAAFYSRTVMSVIIFLFLLSVAANVFFLVTRNTPREQKQGIFTGRYVEEPLLLGPVAYGQVQRGFARKTQKASGTQALLPVSSYVIPKDLVTAPSGAMLLFRDQGIPLDESEVQRIFDRLGVTLHWQGLQLLPTLERWRTADRAFDIALDIERRALTITRVGAFSPAADGPADDDATVAIARAFADSLGIVVPAGQPRIFERAAEAGGPLKTYVVWPMIFHNVPLLDAEAQPVPALQIQVGRLSRKALSMTVTLLDPEHMSKSAYPRASKDVLSASLADGGLLPFSKDLKGKKTTVTYTSLTSAYVLLLGDREYPTYIVPAFLAEFTQGQVSGRTFVPALSAEQFLWYPEVKIPSLPSNTGSVASPATSTGSKKTGATAP